MIIINVVVKYAFVNCIHGRVFVIGGNGMDFVVQDEGEAGGHQGLHLKSNNELDESEIIDGRNGQSAEESINNNYSNLVVGQDSLKW